MGATYTPGRNSDDPLSGIYIARVVFRKTRQGKKSANVQIRYQKKGSSTNTTMEFPTEVNENDLYWKNYKGDRLAVYQRIERFKYFGLNHERISTELGQRLEELVIKLHNMHIQRLEKRK